MITSTRRKIRQRSRVAATRMPQAMVTTSEVVDVVIGLLAETEGVTISELIAERPPRFPTWRSTR